MSLQAQARALGDPTRHRIFEYVRDASAPVGVAELTDHLGLNHNAVRQHLAKLVDARLLSESVAAPKGRGRPRLEYRLDPTTDGRWGVQGPYETLSLMLTDVIRSGESPLEIGRRTALNNTPRPSPDHPRDPAQLLARQMSRSGFNATVEPVGDRNDSGAEPDAHGVDIVLHNCPYAEAALTDADTICDLHLGLARGAAERIGGIEVDRLERTDPRHPACRLVCRVTTPPT